VSGGPGALEELAAEIARITGRRSALREETLLREELGLDSLNLIELAVWTHERFGVNLGRIAEATGKQFHTAGDILSELASGSP
jgi:acyl carrier protein